MYNQKLIDWIDRLKVAYWFDRTIRKFNQVESTSEKEKIN